ncbi:MAG: hypothetical protein V4482_02130 [Pseudomonadota bacterium]
MTNSDFELKVVGRIIIPLEDVHRNQTLVEIIKIDSDNHYTSENLLAVRFVLMVGLANQR